MQNGEQTKKAVLPASAQVEFGKSISLSGITEIVSSTDKCFVARAGESVLTVQGEGLKPRLIDVEKNTAVLSGKTYAVSQSNSLTPKGLIAKLFR